MRPRCAVCGEVIEDDFCYVIDRDLPDCTCVCDRCYEREKRNIKAEFLGDVFCAHMEDMRERTPWIMTTTLEDWGSFNGWD